MTLEQELKDSEREGFIKQIADKLYQGIQTANNKGEPRRWIWELVQNAKDIPNKYGPVKIKVTLSEDKLIFEHNGDPFTINSLTGLLQQVSDKSSSTNTTTTGKFGTGFITTHMLSKIVEVEGVFSYNSGRKLFSLTLDRDADSPEQLIIKVNDLMAKKDELANDDLYPPLPDDYTVKEFSTRFTYMLSSGTSKYAKQGVEDLSRICAYTLLFNANIGDYSVNDISNNIEITISRKVQWTDDNGISFFQTKTCDTSGRLIDEQTLAYLKAETITVAIPVVVENRVLKAILPLPDYIPTLFKDLPLIGTERWLFPVVCDCITFEPTEPRDGLYLHINDEESSWQVETNRKLIEQVTDLTMRFVELLAAEATQPDDLFLLCRSGLPHQEAQVDVITFLKGIQSIYRDRVKLLPLMMTIEGLRPLSECRFPLIEGENAEVIKEFYNICKIPFAKDIPIEDHYERWLPIISEEFEVWGEKLPLPLSELLLYIQNSTNIDSLILSEETAAVQWLNNLYQFLISNGMSDMLRTYQVLPNQHGIFINSKEAQVDRENEIPEVLKDGGDAFLRKYRDTLLYEGIICEAVTKELKIEEISAELNNDIGRAMTKPENISAEHLAAAARICNVKTGSSADDRRLSMIQHLSVIIPEWKEEPLHIPAMRTVYTFDPPLKATVRYCLYQISTTEKVNEFCEKYSLNSVEETINWLQKLIGLLSDSSTEIRPLVMDFAIFPNQNGELCLAKDLEEDVDSISEFLKDIHATLFPDIYIRSKLLFDGFDNQFVDQKYNFADIASDIDREIFKRFSDKEVDQEHALNMIDWLDDSKNHVHKSFFPHIEQHKATIVLDSLPEKKEPVFRLLRLQPDFEKLTALVQSEHFELLAEIADSGVDMVQLNRLYHLATELGGVQQLEAIAALYLEEQTDLRFRGELGTHVEGLFRTTFSDFGDTFEVKREGFEHGQDFALIFPNGFTYRIEIKSFAMGKERVHMSIRQGETAVDHADRYALCVLERPNPLALATNEYFKEHARFIMDIGTRLKPRVDAAKEITNMIKNQETEEGAIDFDSTAYRFRIGKKVWIGTAGKNFEEFTSGIRDTATDRIN